MANKRRKKSKANPVREWISDNLRYLLLILIVVIAALVAFLVYRGLSNRTRSAAETTSISTEASSGTVSTTTVNSSSDETASDSRTEIVTATPTPTETPTPTPTPTPEPTPEVTLEEDSAEVLGVVQNYFYQLQLDGQSEIIQYYDNIHVQTVPGPEEGTYIAYAGYDYKYWNYDSVIPGLTEFYLETDEDGYLQTVDTIPDEVQNYITEVRQTDVIQSLIQSVQTKYQEVLDADPDLSNYLAGNA